MRASHVMAIAVVLYVLSRWAHNEKALDAKIVIAGVFAIVVIGLLDQGRTESIARGFAWLFLIGAAYQVIPPIAKAAGVLPKQQDTTPPVAA